MKCNINIRDVARKIGIDSEVLTFRPYGIEVKNNMINMIENKCSSVEISFNAVEICDVSFVDEVVLNFKDEIKRVYKNEMIIYVSDCKPGVLINLEAAILHKEKKEKSKYPILLLEQCKYSIIGYLEKNLHETFELLSNGDEITATEVSTVFTVEINSASNRLKKLYDLGLAIRFEETDSTGKYYTYKLPDKK